MQAYRCAAEGISFVLSVVVLLAAIFTISELFPDKLIESKWYIGGIAALVGCIVIAILRLSFPAFMDFCLMWAGFEAACMMVCTIQAVFFLLQKIGFIVSYGHFIVGSFDNVAGLASCLGIGLPMGIKWFYNDSRWKQVVTLICKTVCITAIVVSGSRTGLLCVGVCLIMVLPFCGRVKVTIGVAVFVLGLLLTFTVKTDSSRGRWFIAMRTAELIAERPLTGHGYGGFEALYMDRQADWLEKNIGSEYEMLADNMGHPLNEWLALATDYGIVGVIVVLALIASIVSYASRHPSEQGRTGLRIMACAGVFSLFSYPLLYPFTWLMLFMSLIAVFHKSVSHHARQVALFMLIVLPLCGAWLGCRIALAMDLRKVQDKAMLGLSDRMMPRYAELYSDFRNDSRFLYNYAVEQYEAGRYEAALHTVGECKRLLSCYDLCLLEGDVRRALRDLCGADSCYRRAHFMIPSRFIPLYEIYNVALERGDTATSASVAREILTKPIKVRSRETMEIIEEIRRGTDKSLK